MTTPTTFRRRGALWVPEHLGLHPIRHRVVAPEIAAMRRRGSTGTTVALSTGQILSNAPAVFTAPGTVTFTVNRRCRVNLRGIAPGGGGSNADVGGTDAYGAGGGGQGAYATGAAANLVDLQPGITYAVTIGAGGLAHAASAGGGTGGNTLFRINAGTVYLELGAGQGAGAFVGLYHGGLGGVVVTGSGTNGGQGGSGGDGGLAATDHGGAGQATGAGGGGGNGHVGPAGNGGASGGGSAGGIGGAADGIGGLGGSTGGPLGASYGYGGGGMGGNAFNATSGGDGYLDITLVSIL